MREFWKLNMAHFNHWFLNLSKYGEGIPYVLFTITQFVEFGSDIIVSKFVSRIKRHV